MDYDEAMATTVSRDLRTADGSGFLWGPARYPQWCQHLATRAEEEGYVVEEARLPMAGASKLLVGSPGHLATGKV